MKIARVLEVGVPYSSIEASPQEDTAEARSGAFCLRTEPSRFFPESLTDARRWLLAIAESSDDAILAKDVNGTVKSWNKAAERMFGFAAEEIVGQSILKIIPANRISEESDILGRIIRNEKINNFETERQRKDGSVFPVSITVSPIYDEKQGVIGISKIARDLSDRNLQQEKLRVANARLKQLARRLAKQRDLAEQANREKLRFISAMSHELRTPLNGILGYSQLLEMENNLGSRACQQVSAIAAAGKHLLEMINRILDLSEIETNSTELKPKHHDIQEVAMSCVDLMSPVASAKGLILSLAVDLPTCYRLFVDVTRLRQILLNLMGNAIKFTGQGRIELNIHFCRANNAVRFEVRDTGPGIPENKRERLFREFERLDQDSKVEGSGLGLVLSRRIATLLGGDMGHEDNPEGGSVFWLELPMSNAREPDQAAEKPNLIGCLNTLDLLVVDDSEVNRDVAAAFLRSAGHRVSLAADGIEAVDAVVEGDFDIVLMDVRMPGMDGLEATRRIRSLAGKRGQVPIIALSAQTFSKQIRECIDSGMNSHLGKPFTHAGLLDAVHRHYGTVSQKSQGQS